jgi:hypothetical protein
VDTLAAPQQGRSVRENDSMTDKYNEWIGNCQRWRDALQNKLEQHGGNDLVANYSDVAFAFPSKNPHPYSFDYPRIDDKTLLEWAESKGWKVQLAQEMATEKDKGAPPVRFTKE